MGFEIPVLELTERGKELLTCLSFEEGKHEYTFKELKLRSVTQIMRNLGLAPDYSHVSQEVMKRSSDRGTTIHKEIEDYCKTGAIGFTKEFGFFMDWVECNGVVILASEVKVTDGFIAGTIDLLWAIPDEEEECGWAFYVNDNKTTSSIHYDSISWQDSFYEYLAGICFQVRIGDKVYPFKAKKGSVIWLPLAKYGKPCFKYIDLKPKEDIQKAIENEKNGEMFKQNYPVDSAVIGELEYLKIEQANIEARIEELKKQVLDAMTEKAVGTFDTGYAVFTKVITEGRQTFDHKKYIKDHPGDYSGYYKKSAGSTSLKITIKDKGEEKNA